MKQIYDCPLFSIFHAQRLISDPIVSVGSIAEPAGHVVQRQRRSSGQKRESGTGGWPELRGGMVGSKPQVPDSQK